MIVKCLTCGKEFNRKASRATIRKSNYCSKPCWTNEKARFWRSVLITDTCWIWIGSTNDEGYGRFRPNRKSELAHRYSWEHHKGPIPEGLCVCHNCPGKDNPLCVNPSHLWLGTLSENIADGVRKHQFERGEDKHTAKLRNKDIPEIRRLCSSGKTYVEVAKRFNVSPQTIRAVAIGESWSHV